MKKITSTVISVLVAFMLTAQTAPPNAFNYSGVARNPNNTPIATQNIGVQFAILKSNPTTGIVVYSENHFTATDAFGLFNLSIGTGAVQSGNFANIDWSNDNYFLRVGIDPAGGTNFATIGATQFLSVPYALYAKNAGSVAGGSNNSIVPKFNGTSIFDPSINMAFTGSNSLYYYDFLTDSNYRFTLLHGQNIGLSPPSFQTVYTDDTITFSNVYFSVGSNLSDIEFYKKTIGGIHRSVNYGVFYIPSNPSTVAVPSNLYRRGTNGWTLSNTAGYLYVKTLPNNPSVTGFNLTFPITLTIEKQ
jgi:hypothetical protein